TDLMSRTRTSSGDSPGCTDSSSATAALTRGVAMLVPSSPTITARFPDAPMPPVDVQPSPHTSSVPEPPGAASVGDRAAVPKFEYAARFPARLLAATLTTCGQSAGAVPAMGASSLPAAATTVTPRAQASAT